MSFQHTTGRTELLVLTQANTQHRLEVRDSVPLTLKVSQLIEHEPRLVKRLLIALSHVRLIEVEIHKLRNQNENQFRVLHEVWRRSVVIIRLFILISAVIHCSPAYVFAMDSASMPSDGGASWVNYISVTSQPQSSSPMRCRSADF